MREALRAIIQHHRGERRQLLAILRDVQETWRCVPDDAITIVAEEMDLPRVHVEGTASFYHFLSRTHRGAITIYLNTSATSEMAGGSSVGAAFEQAVGTTLGSTTPDQMSACNGELSNRTARHLDRVVADLLAVSATAADGVGRPANGCRMRRGGSP